MEGCAKGEAQSINSSLSALGRVIKSLGAKNNSMRKGSSFAGHVPYRDATLTMLLRDSFGGKSCTSVVINVAGEFSHAEESLCSLRFGERMSVVRNAPTVVVDGDAGDNAQHLRGALKRAREELAAMAAEGHAGGFVKGAPKSEVKSLADGMRKLAETDREVRECVEQIAERRSGGLSTSALAGMSTHTTTTVTPLPPPSLDRHSVSKAPLITNRRP